MTAKTAPVIGLPPRPCTCLVSAATDHDKAQHVILDELGGVARGRCRPRVGIQRDGQVSADTKLERRCLDLIRVVSGLHLPNCPRGEQS